MKNKFIGDLVSIIVPVYNVEQYLEKCLDSIINQTYTDLDIILIDDGSTDKSSDICHEFSKKDSRVRVYNQKNRGASAARNLGLCKAKGEYISFVDSDDWIEINAIETFVNACKDVDIVCAGRYDVDFISGEKKPGLCPETEITVNGEITLSLALNWKNVDFAVWDKFFRKDILENVRFYEGEINEDVLFNYEAFISAKKIRLINAHLYNYVHREGSVTSSVFSEKIFVLDKNAKILIENIETKYPDLVNDAVFYRIKMLEYILCVLAVQEKKTVSCHKREIKYFSKQIRQYTKFYMTDSRFSAKDKFRYLSLNNFYFYRIFFCIFKKVRGL